MAVIIDTSTAESNKHGLDDYGVPQNGFTSGNQAGSIQPTQLSSDWFDAAQQEINNAIRAGVSFALDKNDPTQLAFSIDNQHIDRRPRYQTGVVYTFRSQNNSELTTTPGENSLVRERTGYSDGLLSGTVTTVLAMPTTSNSQNLFSFEVCSVQTDTITNYGNARITVSARNAAGVVTVQNTSTDYSDAPLAGWTAAISTSGVNVTLRITIPAAPVGKEHHVFARCRAIGVIRA